MALILLAAGVAFAPSVSAQPADLGLGRRLGDPTGTPPEPDESESESESEEGANAGGDDDEGPWAGPQIQLTYGYFKLADGYGGGDTHVAGFEVFFGWAVTELRTGVFAEIGGRDFSLGGDDLVARGGVEIGYQLTGWLDPFVPHISVIGTGGVVVAERFETSVAYPMGGGGVELGAEVRLVRNLHIAVSFSYVRLEMDGAGFDVFMFRAGVGL